VSIHDDEREQGLPDDQAVAAVAGAMMPPHLDGQPATSGIGIGPDDLDAGDVEGVMPDDPEDAGTRAKDGAP
jgi:hypothetical protein